MRTLSGVHGEYELGPCLRRGGMAEVFLAKRRNIAGFERSVAVKRVLPEFAGDELFVSMFLDEARIAAELVHPNIVQTLDLGVWDGQYFIALEYIEGTSVRELLARCAERGRRVPRRFACHILAEVCAGLSYAHNKRADGQPMNIVHRDVSPANILVGVAGEVKLIDFGVAKARQRRAWTMDGTVKGKTPYLAPERLLGREGDRRGDIYAAGVVLWELLTTERLYRGGSELEIAQRILHQPPPPPSSRNPTVPRALDAIVGRALARDPDARYQDAAELEDDLLGYMRRSGDRATARGLSRWAARVMAEAPGTATDPPTRLAGGTPSPDLTLRLPLRAPRTGGVSR